MPKLPRQIARQLAFYGYGAGPGVLAPRGWHCLGLYGSSGSFLIITPERHSADEFFKADRVEIRGPAVQISVSDGGTSGRDQVAEGIARYFPAYGSFLRHVIKEDREIGYSIEPLRRRPYRTDVIKRRTANYVRFRTPAARKGEGTNSRLVPSDLPIEGFRRVFGPIGEPTLVGTEVRLQSNQARLIDAILAEAAK